MLRLITISLLFLFGPFLLLPALSADYKDPITGMDFNLIEGGSFLMGDFTKQDNLSLPVHRVTVKAFYIGTHEVTFAQYDIFSQQTGREELNDEGWGRGTRPAINSSYVDATAFAEWLSEQTGKKFRLPTEAEWEYAARGGQELKFPWGNELGTNNANCAGCGSQWDGKTTAPTGSFAENGYGLFDVAGNVYEWTLDSNHQSYKGAPSVASAWVENNERLETTARMTRGGSWAQQPIDAATYTRCVDGPLAKSNEIGFRIVMEVPDSN